MRTCLALVLAVLIAAFCVAYALNVGLAWLEA